MAGPGQKEAETGVPGRSRRGLGPVPRTPRQGASTEGPREGRGAISALQRPRLTRGVDRRSRGDHAVAEKQDAEAGWAQGSRTGQARRRRPECPGSGERRAPRRLRPSCSRPTSPPPAAPHGVPAGPSRALGTPTRSARLSSNTPRRPPRSSGAAGAPSSPPPAHTPTHHGAAELSCLRTSHLPQLSPHTWPRVSPEWASIVRGPG